MPLQTLVILGFGYVAQHFVAEIDSKGFSVYGSSRQAQLAFKWPHTNVKLSDIESTLSHLKQATHLLICIPPDSNGDLIVQKYKYQLLLAKKLKWVGYLSSTAVYGDHKGAVVNEASACQGQTSRALARIKAEQQWLELSLPVHIFRLSAIYGPSRNALMRIRNKTHLIYKENHHFSRMHVADIVQALVLSMNNPTPGEIYNLADDKSAPTHEIDAFAAQLLGLKIPPLLPLEQCNLSPGHLSYYQENKRISNDKIKNLGLNLLYPSYQEGLLSLLPNSQEQP